jgi:hypothetical protein
MSVICNVQLDDRFLPQNKYQPVNRNCKHEFINWKLPVLQGFQFKGENNDTAYTLPENQ